MADFTLPLELLNYMSIDNDPKFICVRNHANENVLTIDGFDYVSVGKGNALRANNGETYVPHHASIMYGNNITVQLCKRNWINEKNFEVIKSVKLEDYFNNLPVVVVVSNENLQMFAPIFDDKLDLALFIKDLRIWNETYNRESAAWYNTVDEMISLAKFLYRNNKNKIKSILEELD